MILIDKNINHICKKVGQKISVLGRLRNDLNNEQKLYLYKSIIQSHFSYCATIIYLSNSTNIERLQKLQNKCMRLILKTDRFRHSRDMLTKFKIMSVSQLITFQTLIFINEIVNGQAPNYLKNKIKY